ncbi:interferon-induced protein 44-like isoform X1 [Acipenser ruthenus]|uniref:interferon-induced protein 44-like isoform X1 n=1 Tax=Acipenser ruthenus TaxID=7906 RepID=UPI002741EB87|nr:interferon-induced protein 44-like isoform X1 [Acipenser ruthenus]XP_058864232.1 interferon-induced protein 44-like isoform X1 [Acipenser ruthenus]
MAWVQTREFKVYEHGGRNTEICEQFTRKIEEKGYFKVSVRTDIKSFLYVHEVTRVFHDIKSALNSAGNINSYAAVVIFRKLTPYEKPDSSDLYSTPLPLGIPNELPIVACYWFENDCKQQLCDCEENKESVKKLVRLIKRELQTDTDSGSPSSKSSRWTNFWNSFSFGSLGGQSSAPARDEPKPEPWREDEFSDEAYMKLQEEIQNHQPHPKASTTNILITGNVGSGKSSFLNSVLSELRREELNGRMQNIEAVRPGAQTSVTQHLRCHKFTEKIKIFDTAGFELEKTENAMKILKIIDGEVAEGSKFDDILKTKSSMEGDKIHCVVLVISIHSAENLALIQFYKEFIGMLTETGVPCQLLVTCVDELFEKTEDLKSLYRRRDIKQKIEMLAKEMRISMCNVLVVSNYFEGEKINQIKGTLLLEAFAQMLMAAKPFQERM